MYLDHMIVNYILQFTNENGASGAIPGILLITLMLKTGIAVSLYSLIVKKKIMKKGKRNS